MAITEQKTIHEIGFFDFMRCFFCDPKKYKQLTRKAKEKHIFMFYRTMSIMYPAQMHAVNYIHDIRLVDQLQKAFGKQNGPYPRWLYTKAENEKTVVQKLDAPQELIQKYMQVHGLEPKSFEFLLSLDFDGVQKELNILKVEMENNVSKERVAKKKD